MNKLFLLILFTYVGVSAMNNNALQDQQQQKLICSLVKHIEKSEAENFMRLYNLSASTIPQESKMQLKNVIIGEHNKIHLTTFKNHDDDNAPQCELRKKLSWRYYIKKFCKTSFYSLSPLGLPALSYLCNAPAQVTNFEIFCYFFIVGGTYHLIKNQIKKNIDKLTNIPFYYHQKHDNIVLMTKFMEHQVPTLPQVMYVSVPTMNMPEEKN